MHYVDLIGWACLTNHSVYIYLFTGLFVQHDFTDAISSSNLFFYVGTI